MSAKFLLIVALVQSALRKELFFAAFAERFIHLLWEILPDTFGQYLEKIT